MRDMRSPVSAPRYSAAKDWLSGNWIIVALSAVIAVLLGIVVVLFATQGSAQPEPAAATQTESVEEETDASTEETEEPTEEPTEEMTEEAEETESPEPEVTPELEPTTEAVQTPDPLPTPAPAPAYSPAPAPAPAAPPSASPEPEPAPMPEPEPEPTGPSQEDIEWVQAERAYLQDQIMHSDARIVVMQADLEVKQFHLRVAESYNDELRARTLRGEIATLEAEINSERLYGDTLRAELANLPDW